MGTPQKASRFEFLMEANNWDTRGGEETNRISCARLVETSSGDSPRCAAGGPWGQGLGGTVETGG